MIDGRFDEVTGDVAFMVSAMIGGPAFGPALAISKGIGGLQIAVGLARGKDDGNPFFQRLPHFGLGRDHFRIALWINHLCDAHRFHRLVDPGI